MNLRYTINKYGFYENGYNNGFYRYWETELPFRFYKGQVFGLRYWNIFNVIDNRPSGIKIDY